MRWRWEAYHHMRYVVVSTWTWAGTLDTDGTGGVIVIESCDLHLKCTVAPASGFNPDQRTAA